MMINHNRVKVINTLIIQIFLMSVLMLVACTDRSRSVLFRNENLENVQEGSMNNCLKNIFTDNEQFIFVEDGNGKSMFVSDIPNTFQNDDPYLKIMNFAVVDLDRDGSEEIVLKVNGVAGDMGGNVIFHEICGKVYAYRTNSRTLLSIKTDGTYTYSGWVLTNDGCAVITAFDEKGYIEDRFTYESGDYNGADTFVVDYKQSTEEGYNKALSLQENKPDVDWHEFNDENISKYIAR